MLTCMNNEGTDGPQLAEVKHELDTLNSARMIWGLSASEQLRYKRLCDIERELLSRVAA